MLTSCWIWTIQKRYICKFCNAGFAHSSQSQSVSQSTDILLAEMNFEHIGIQKTWKKKMKKRKSQSPPFWQGMSANMSSDAIVLETWITRCLVSLYEQWSFWEENHGRQYRTRFTIVCHTWWYVGPYESIVNMHFPLHLVGVFFTKFMCCWRDDENNHLIICATSAVLLLRDI
jgi:hypothetical protein